MNKIKRKFVRTIIRIPNDLWNEITNILPNEKPENTTDRPIISHRKVLDGILYVLGTGCQWKLLPKDYGSGSRCHRSFQEWMQLGIFDKLWSRLLNDMITKKESNGYGNRLIVYQ